MATLAAMVVVVSAIVAVVVWFRKWVRSLVASVDETTKQLRTSNGHTVGQYVEEIRREVSTLGEWAGENYAMGKQALAEAQQANTLARHAHDRLDAFLAGRKDDNA